MHYHIECIHKPLFNTSLYFILIVGLICKVPTLHHKYFYAMRQMFIIKFLYTPMIYHHLHDLWINVGSCLALCQSNMTSCYSFPMRNFFAQTSIKPYHLIRSHIDQIHIHPTIHTLSAPSYDNPYVLVNLPSLRPKLILFSTQTKNFELACCYDQQSHVLTDSAPS